MPTFPTPGSIEATIDVIGDVRLRASDRADTVVGLRAANPSKPADVRAAELAVVECTNGTLLVKTTRARRHPFGGPGSVEVTIDLPTGSRVIGGSALGHLSAEGALGDCRFKTALGSIRLDQTGALQATTGLGSVTVDRIDGAADVKTGSGDVTVGAIAGAAAIKNTNGRTTIGEVSGDLRVKAANGDVTIGRAASSVVAKTANGDIRIAEVSRGTIVVETAAGDLAVGVREGTAAWLDVVTRFGKVRNTLEHAEAPTTSDATVEVRGRTAVGDILIGRSSAAEATRAGVGSDPA